MSKFNSPATRPAVSSPVASERMPSGHTHEGAAGYARDARSELFLLAVTNMVGENTFYEAAGRRDDRYEQLVRAVAVADPDWMLRFLTWLRSEANMRSAALVGAAVAVHARLAARTTEPVEDAVPNRTLVDAVLQRADEPGELLAYWTATFGRAVPKPVKRGVADAVQRLYTERNLVKWDSDAHGWRFGDVLETVHPAPREDRQGELFKHAIDRRHNRGEEIPASLELLRVRAELMAWPVQKRRELFQRPELDGARSVLNTAGMTWEALAGWLQGPMDARAWEAIIPSMGYMALLRNLRNFDKAGVSDEVAAVVAAKLADPAQVARSRQFPMRFLSAYRAVPSLRWSYPLEQAITHSLANVPTLGGRTLVLIDTSGSMAASFSRDGTLMRWDAAALFGIALGGRCEDADIVSFSNGYQGREPSIVFRSQPGESLLRAVERWKTSGYFINGGTDTAGAVQRHLRPGFHDRVVILTDEQAAHGDVDTLVPREIPLYTWNLAGYQYGHAPSGGRNRHTFGGLTDQGFRMIPLLESGRDGHWPF
ncbi:MAG TPA: TROVE domain-containing protein [Pseudonocardiaceae bacterium]|jgi:hypothetical protein|nr:TROVE domain-containing protein [Pseudonocardiaceae bacterium]